MHPVARFVARRSTDAVLLSSIQPSETNDINRVPWALINYEQMAINMAPIPSVAVVELVVSDGVASVGRSP